MEKENHTISQYLESENWTYRAMDRDRGAVGGQIHVSDGRADGGMNGDAGAGNAYVPRLNLDRRGSRNSNGSTSDINYKIYI